MEIRNEMAVDWMDRMFSFGSRRAFVVKHKLTYGSVSDCWPQLLVRSEVSHVHVLVQIQQMNE